MIGTNLSRSTPSLTLSTLESSLLESDPCGPLADFFISMLSTIRRLEVSSLLIHITNACLFPITYNFTK